MHSEKPPRVFIPFATAFFVLLGTVPSARAQCYAFSSSSSGILVTANITITKQTIMDLTPGQTRLISFDYTGFYTQTIGGTTVFGSGAATKATIGYEGVPGTVPWTTLVMGSSGDPGTKGEVSWAINLNGTGDLLPNGLTPTLPPISAWQYNPGSGTPPGNHILIAANGVSIKSNLNVVIDGIGSCGGSLSQLLGDPAHTPGCVQCGDPFNVATGNLFEEAADYQTTGPSQLGLMRYYNSMSAPNTLAASLGKNWRSNYDRYLIIGSATSVTAERPDGQQLSFTLGGGAWTTGTDSDVKLTNSGTTWTLTDNDDTVETYKTASTTEALLQTVRARNGYTQTLQYGANNQLNTVTDSFQRQLSLTYNGGLLQTVTTPDGLVLTYGYSAGHLTSVSYSTAPVTSKTYLYENTALPNALTGIMDEDGNRYSTWTYDAMGRVLTSQNAGGAGLTSIAYNDTDGSRTVTNALGAKTVFHFTTLQNVPKVTQIDRLPTSTTAAAALKITYDRNGYTASMNDWDGNVTNYVNDVHGQPTSIIEAAGTPQARTTTVTYHSTFHLPVSIVQPGLTTTFTYDSNGEMLTRTLADTTTNTAPYSTRGQTRTWTYTWSNFLLTSVKPPRTDVNALTKFTYDSTGALIGKTNALGQAIQVTQHLPGGLPLTIIDANGVSTQLTYDARQRLLTSTINTAVGPLTGTFSYDAAGNLLVITSPDGSALSNSYDAAHRLTGISDLFGQQILYTLDAFGNRTQTSVLDSGGTQQRKRSDSFDALGRVLRDTGGAGQITTFSYDANSNPLTITDPLSRVTLQAFDTLNRRTRITDPAKGMSTVSYDAYNRPTSVTDPNGGVTTYLYDGFGDVIQKASPDSGMTVYRYDLNTNLTQRVDSSGVIANFTYDALNRRLTTSYPGNPAENVTYSYDQSGAGFSVGRLTTVADAAGTLTRSYDERGNALSEVRVFGTVKLLTAYTYDAAGRVASITYPSGWTITYTRDAMGRTTAMTSQAPDGSNVPIVASTGYLPFGPVNALTLGNGVTETRTFDLDYRMTNLADNGTGALQDLTYVYDAANNVLSIADGVTAANSQSFGYDALNRLTSANGNYGSLGYTYDSVGNRMSQSRGGSTSAYTYAPHSNQLTSASADGATQAVGYTKAGLINNFNPTAGGVTSLLYNQSGRLAMAMAVGGAVAQYTYDGFGQRLIRLGVVTGTTLYQYDTRGRLIEQTDDQGSPMVDYVYMGNRPVATLAPSTGQIYFLHDDRLGAPQVATDSSQNPVWVASYGPFGEMSAVPSGIVQDLRLPGQEFDVETGLYHNGFRDYVPEWGRYLQSDPIGLAGGLNSYAYVGGNPLRSIDRLGLEEPAPLNTASKTEDAIEWGGMFLLQREIEGASDAGLVVNTSKVGYAIWHLYHDLNPETPEPYDLPYYQGQFNYEGYDGDYLNRLFWYATNHLGGLSHWDPQYTYYANVQSAAQAQLKKLGLCPYKGGGPTALPQTPEAPPDQLPQWVPGTLLPPVEPTTTQ